MSGDIEREFRDMRRQFARSARRRRLNDVLRQLRRHGGLILITSVVTGAVVSSIVAIGPTRTMTGLRHIAAAPNCNAARSVGLAPAYRGEPGYYLRHDRDRDGWACEPWPPLR